MPPSPLALALRCVRIKNNAKIDRSMMDLIGYKLTTLTHTMREENLSISKASHHFNVVRASGAPTQKLSLPRHSTVVMFSLATEVEEPKIEALTPSLVPRPSYHGVPVRGPGYEATLTPCFFSMYTWSSIRATSGETTRIALLPPSLCSIRNGRIW